MTIVSQAVQKMAEGDGVATLPGFIDRETCRELTSIVESYEPDRLGSVRCLLDKSPHFEAIVTNEIIEAICIELFGTDYRLSALGARIMPPRSRGKPEHAHVTSAHVDYPYPAVIKQTPGTSSKYYGVPLGLQVLIPLVDLTLENGATAYLPYSHKLHRLPEKGEFEDKFANGEVERLEISAGTLACWSGPVWHCAMPNDSDFDRTVVTMLLSPPFINHPHLMRDNYSKKYLESRPEKLQRLLSMKDFTAMVFEQPAKKGEIRYA